MGWWMGWFVGGIVEEEVQGSQGCGLMLGAGMFYVDVDDCAFMKPH